MGEGVQRAATHRIYIDDSGEKEYGEKTSRYFVYAGVVVALEYERRINDTIAALKRGVFGTESVEVKSNWLRMPRERDRRYLKPFGVTEDQVGTFASELVSVLARSELLFVAAVIDKPQMQKKYKNPHYPSATAYQFLLQRYQKHMTRLSGFGQVTIDSMDGSSPKHNQWRDLLRNQHRALKKNGCNFTGLGFHDVAEEVRFGDSARFHLLQVADLVAYNVLRQFRDHGDEWDQGVGELTMYRPLRDMLPRFMRGPEPTSALQGWGVVKWPSVNNGRWCLTAADLGAG